jgi:hypothetical protein
MEPAADAPVQKDTTLPGSKAELDRTDRPPRGNGLARGGLEALRTVMMGARGETDDQCAGA